jgi:hypothetical protein
MATTILTYDPNKLPANMLAMPHHPSADAYVEGLRGIQRAIVEQSLSMKRKDVLMVKMFHKATPKSQIAKELKCTPQTIEAKVRSDAGQKLLALLAYYQEAIDGPNEALRRNILWRVAAKNEDIAPKVTISAVAELNKMDNIGKDALANLTTGDVSITINQQLIRGALDQ